MLFIGLPLSLVSSLSRKFCTVLSALSQPVHSVFRGFVVCEGRCVILRSSATVLIVDLLRSFYMRQSVNMDEQATGITEKGKII
jgi:hypothetical protein